MINSGHSCVPSDKDRLSVYAPIITSKWKDFARRHLTPKQAQNELILDSSTCQKRVSMKSILISCSGR